MNEFAQMIKWILPPGKSNFENPCMMQNKNRETKKQIVVNITPAECMSVSGGRKGLISRRSGHTRIKIVASTERETIL